MRNSYLNHFIGKLLLATLLLLNLVFVFRANILSEEFTYTTLNQYGFYPMTIASEAVAALFGLLCYSALLFAWLNTIQNAKLIQSNKMGGLLCAGFYLSLWPEFLFQPFLLLAGLCFVGMSFFFFKIYKQTSIQMPVFLASLLCGIAAFFYWPAFFILPVFWIGISLIRPFNIRTYLLSLIGVLLPFAYFLAVPYLLDYPVEFPNEARPSIQTTWDQLTSKWGVSFAFTVFVMLLGFYNLTLRPKMIVLERNQNAYLLFCLLLSLLCFFFFGKVAWLFSLFPAIVFFENAYKSLTKKWIFELIILLFLVANLAQLLI